MARSAAPMARLAVALQQGAGFSLEVWVAAGRNNPHRHARIVSCSRDMFARNFTLAQQGRDLIMRLRTTRTDANALEPYVRLKDAFATHALQHIVVTYDFRRQHIYIDGGRRFSATKPGGDFDNWDRGYYLVFGNELTGDRPWLGELYAVALYDRALRAGEIERLFAAGAGSREPDRRGALAGYDFNITPTEPQGIASALDIPRYLIQGSDRFLLWPHDLAALSASETADIWANIVLFMPLGFLLYAPAHRRLENRLRSVAAVVAIGALTTVCFESIQYFLPGRTSSLIDTLANTSGAVLGVVIHAVYLQIRLKFANYHY